MKALIQKQRFVRYNCEIQLSQLALEGQETCISY